MERIPDSQPSGKGAQCLDTPVLLVGLDSRTATVQDSAEVSREVSRARSSLAPGTCLGETTACLCSPGNLCASACGSFANSHAPLGTAQMALGGWLDNQLVHARSGLLLSGKPQRHMPQQGSPNLAKVTSPWVSSSLKGPECCIGFLWLV